MGFSFGEETPQSFNFYLGCKKNAQPPSWHVQEGQPHSHLQGTAPDGLARTAKAAVYPREMCQRMKQDVVKFLHQRGLLKTAAWPRPHH